MPKIKSVRAVYRIRKTETTTPKKEPKPHSMTHKKYRFIAHRYTTRIYVATRPSSAAPSIHVVINQYQQQNNIHKHHEPKLVDEYCFTGNARRHSKQQMSCLYSNNAWVHDRHKQQTRKLLLYVVEFTR